MKTYTLDALIWVLIYGGLIGVGLGLSVQRTNDTLGTTVIVIGGAVALIGVALIYLRSRRPDTSSTSDKTP